MAGISSDGRKSYVDEDGNPVIIDTQGQIVDVIVESEGGEEPSAAQNSQTPSRLTAEDGGVSSPSSNTPEKSDSSTEIDNPSPAPTTESPSEVGPTANGSVDMTDGGGPGSPTAATEPSDQDSTDDPMSSTPTES